MKLLFSFALFCAFVLCPDACANGVRDGLSLAAYKALPALFPFFLASALLVRTGFGETLGRFVARPLRWLYGLPPAAASAVILGLIGGYPVGAMTATDLLRQGVISRQAAARVNLFCNCASPGFCIGLVGLGIFGSARTGAVLYGIHVLAALLTGLIAARGGDGRMDSTPHRTHTPREGFSISFCAAVQQAASTALTVTAFLTVFSILLRLLAPALDSIPFGMALAGVIELTSGLDRLALVPLPTGGLMTLASFLLGFGGLAVQFQVRALAAPQDLPLDGFLSTKLLHGALAALLTALLFRFSPTSLAVFAPAANSLPLFRPLPMALMLCAVLFAIWGGKKAKNKI
nr:nucleoside recognition domain-containing protein [uncultured Agathobaculum sp.]